MSIKLAAAAVAFAVACGEPPPMTDHGVVVVFDDDPAPVTSDSDADAGMKSHDDEVLP